jgi:dethiobiotin synthetase
VTSRTQRGVFVTGTDTGIGKTFVCTLLLQQLAQRGIRSAGMKPVASGCDRTSLGLRNDDALQLIAASGVQLEYELVNRYAFEPPIAPHIAAQQTGVDIDSNLICKDLASTLKLVDYVVVEGVGGWQVPLSDDVDLSSLAIEMALPVVLVVGIRLGCISHALLTCEAISRSGLPFIGWVANYCDAGADYDPDVIETLETRIATPLLGAIPHLGEPAVAADIELPDLAERLLSVSA